MQPPSPTLIRCIRAEPGMARPQSNARCGARSNGRRWPTLPDTDRQIPTLNSLSDWHYTNVCLPEYNCPRYLSTLRVHGQRFRKAHTSHAMVARQSGPPDLNRHWRLTDAYKSLTVSIIVDIST